MHLHDWKTRPPKKNCRIETYHFEHENKSKLQTIHWVFSAHIFCSSWLYSWYWCLKNIQSSLQNSPILCLSFRIGRLINAVYSWQGILTTRKDHLIYNLNMPFSSVFDWSFVVKKIINNWLPFTFKGFCQNKWVRIIYILLSHFMIKR